MGHPKRKFRHVESAGNTEKEFQARGKSRKSRKGRAGTQEEEESLTRRSVFKGIL